jgi:hypothetical protein
MQARDRSLEVCDEQVDKRRLAACKFGGRERRFHRLASNLSDQLFAVRRMPAGASDRIGT